jgi:aspartate/methionine/tyrosine aminotransferase
MEITPFQLERYFARYEFSARYLLSSSDCEALPMMELLELADAGLTEMWQGLKLGYTESQGHSLLREAIAELYPGYTASEVLVAAPEEAIFLSMQALLRTGDHVICTFPGYQSLYEVARSLGCEVSLWEPHEERGWRFALDDLSRLLRPDTRLVVVNFPHNPTGYLPPLADFQALIDLLRQNDIYLLSDEMYQYLTAVDGTALPAACELYERAVSLSGLSKSFGLPGLRIGWLASRDKGLLERVSLFKDYTTICSSAPSELLAIIALGSREAILDGQLRRVRRNMDVLDTFFEQHRDFISWNRPKGGSIGFPRLLAVQDSYEFCQRLVVETGIMLVPSRIFQFGDHHVRIGFGRQDLPQAIQRFGEYLQERFG